MKKIILYILIGSLFLFLQISDIIANNISLNGVRPDFILIFIILIAYYSNPIEGMLVGFVFGLILDIFTFSFFGLNAFIFTLIGYVIGLLKKHITIESTLFIVFLTLIATLFKIFFYYAFGHVFDEIFVTQKAVLINFMINILYNIFITPLIYYLFNLLFVKTKIFRNIW